MLYNKLKVFSLIKSIYTKHSTVPLEVHTAQRVSSFGGGMHPAVITGTDIGGLAPGISQLSVIAHPYFCLFFIINNGCPLLLFFLFFLSLQSLATVSHKRGFTVKHCCARKESLCHMYSAWPCCSANSPE